MSATVTATCDNVLSEPAIVFEDITISMRMSLALYILPLCVTDRHVLKYGTYNSSHCVACFQWPLQQRTALIKNQLTNRYLSLLLNFLLLFFFSMGNSVHALFPLSLSSPHWHAKRFANVDGRSRALSDWLNDHISEPAASKCESCRTIPRTREQQWVTKGDTCDRTRICNASLFEAQ